MSFSRDFKRVPRALSTSLFVSVRFDAWKYMCTPRDFIPDGSVSPEYTSNMLASMIAKNYNVKQVIMHINSSTYLKSMRRIGVDAIVSKNISAVNEVLKLIRSDQQDLPVSRFEDLNGDAIELSVLEESRYIRKKITIDQIPKELCVGAICRNNEMIIPNNHTEIYAEDELLLITKEENISKAEKLFQ